MNTMGKILVGLLLAFSLITCFLIVMAFTTRTNWREGYERLQRELTIAQTDRDLIKKEMEEAIAARAKETELEKREVGELRKQLENSQIQMKDALERMNAAVTLKNNAEITVTKMRAENAALLSETGSQDMRLKERQDKVLELEQKVREYQQKAIKFEIDYQSAQDRNEKLINQLTERTKELEHLRGEKAEQAATLVTNPPAEDVKGRVTAADPQSGYVTINLGSDHGLTKGNTLEVFRRQPRPQYVGVLRILEVRNGEAVGRLVGQRSAAIQAGDEVASNILSRR